MTLIKIKELSGTPDADGDLWEQACVRAFAIRDLLKERAELIELLRRAHPHIYDYIVIPSATPSPTQLLAAEVAEKLRSVRFG